MRLKSVLTFGEHYTIKQESFSEYFTDFFAGDFGHCTDNGNRLLAENIAEVILKEEFGICRDFTGRR